jgi:hypothetical protein
MKPKTKTKTKTKVKSKSKVERKINLRDEFLFKLATSVSKLLNTTEDVEKFAVRLQHIMRIERKVYYRSLLVTESDFWNALDDADIIMKSCVKKKKIYDKFYIDYTEQMMNQLSDTFHYMQDSWACRIGNRL